MPGSQLTLAICKTVSEQYTSDRQRVIDEVGVQANKHCVKPRVQAFSGRCRGFKPPYPKETNEKISRH